MLVFLKQTRSVLEAVVRVCPLHNDKLKRSPSDLARVEAVLNISAQKTVFHLKKIILLLLSDFSHPLAP